jgi:hypothetical protein
VKHFHHKIVELGSRFPRDYAIIHSAVLSFVCFLATGIIPETAKERAALPFPALALRRRARVAPQT